jgi:hypothetical protein
MAYISKKHTMVITLSMLASAHHEMQADRYVNYDRTLKVTAQLKALERNPELAAAFEKDFEQKYFRILRPREYNKLYALILDLLSTAEFKPLNQQENALQILEMINDELRGLINRHGYREELIALSYRASLLCSEINRSSWVNPISAAAIKRSIQDLLAEALLTDMVFERIKHCVTKHVEKTKLEATRSATGDKESHAESDIENPDIKHE